ncbi:MAG: ABC transporter ATP-binding protein [Cyclobacteriaceae bacterium]|nr:ABC transporter ATP-binding protein [Cyclobacteriaceae bacterium]
MLEVKAISKKFRIQHLTGSYLSLRERISQGLTFEKKVTEEFWALDNITFDVNPGESLAIIGRNGAGKSTLLKILSKITPPTQGRIICRGRVASLLEVGTGFHPELTGRENIFFNGSLLGMKRKEIDVKFDEIVEFSGTRKFLDMPLKHYSSGMQLRLAFSVAAFLEPEILIIDEVLAVGDAEFQKKCLGKMEEVSSSGRTILFVSHNLAAVENLCTRAILLDQGKIIASGLVEEVVRKYQSSHALTNATFWERKTKPKESIYFKSVEVKLSSVQPVHILKVVCKLISQAQHKSAFLAFDVSNSMGITIFQAIPEVLPFIEYSPDGKEVISEIQLPPLIPDQYKVSAWIGSHNTETICWDKEIVQFEITNSPTPGRNFPHSHHNGFLVPPSRIVHG